MFDLLGTETPLPVKFFIAFAVVLALIGLTAWLVRRFGANRLGAAGRGGRQPRLAVIDAATVDGRRRLVLIRRDNIEHLLMIGGPTDLVVEPNIVRAAGNRDVVREPGRAEPAARNAAPASDSWPLAPVNEPAPAAPAARSYRSQATEEPWHAPEPGARARPADSLTGLAAELSTRLNPPEPPAPRVEPPPRVVAAPPLPPEPAPAPQNDHNLAEMAQQLEAALRRPPETRAPVTDALAAAPPRPAQRDYKLRVDPRLEPKFDIKPEPQPEARAEPKFEAPKFDTPKAEPKAESKFEPKFEPRSEPRLDAPPPAPPRPPGKDVYDNLEEEMASLLGRPSGKT